MHYISTVCFDLDDTLWDMRPVIRRAEQALYDWFAANCPRVTARYSPAGLIARRVAVGEQHPELRHDLTSLRYLVLRQLLAESGYPESLAEAAFAAFLQERNRVELYRDVRPVLQQLASSHRLLALTNGNADLVQIGLEDCFETVYTARAVGSAKPDRRFFLGVIERAGLDPGSTLHVGDHPENDIVAAKAVGMRTAWLNRQGLPWLHDDCLPDHELADLSPLPGLLRA